MGPRACQRCCQRSSQLMRRRNGVRKAPRVVSERRNFGRLAGHKLRHVAARKVQVVGCETPVACFSATCRFSATGRSRRARRLARSAHLQRARPEPVPLDPRRAARPCVQKRARGSAHQRAGLRHSAASSFRAAARVPCALLAMADTDANGNAADAALGRESGGSVNGNRVRYNPDGAPLSAHALHPAPRLRAPPLQRSAPPARSSSAPRSSSGSSAQLARGAVAQASSLRVRFPLQMCVCTT